MAFLWRFVFNDFKTVFSKGSSSLDLKEPGSAAKLQKKTGSPLSIKVILDIPVTIFKAASHHAVRAP